MNAFTGSVDPTLGVNEGINRSRWCPARDIAIGDVEFGFGDIQVVKISGLGERHESRWFVSTAAAQKAGIQSREALVVGRDPTKFLVVARVEVEVYPGKWFASVQ
jgi:hypothetical protein